MIGQATSRLQRKGEPISNPSRSAAFPTLETPRLVLRELQPDDAAAVFEFYSDLEVVRYYDSPLAELRQAREEIAHHRRRFEDSQAIRWGIVVKGEGRVAGTCGYLARDTACRHARLSYVLARRHWNKGLMTEVLSAVVRFGFERYGLHRIEAQVAVPNRASLRVLQKLGFREEGLLRERFFVDGRFHDETMLSLLEGDFAPAGGRPGGAWRDDAGCSCPPRASRLYCPYTPGRRAMAGVLLAVEIGMRIVLPLPPGVNNQYVTVGNRRVLSKEAARFKRAAKRLLLGAPGAAALDDAEHERLRQGYLGLYLDFYFETPLKRDLDGGLKITQDAICEALGLDDRRVVDIHLVKRIDPLHPRVEVELEAIGDWEFDRQYVYLGRSATADES